MKARHTPGHPETFTIRKPPPRRGGKPAPGIDRNYLREIRRLANFCEPLGLDPDEASPEVINEFLRLHPCSVSTRRLALSAIRKYFRDITRVTGYDPTAGIPSPKQFIRNRYNPAAPLPVEVRSLLDGICTTRVIGLRDFIIILLAYYGLTAASIVGLDAADYDRDDRTGKAILRVRSRGLVDELVLPDAAADAIDAFRRATPPDGHPALIRSIRGKSDRCGGGRLDRTRVGQIVRKRALSAGLNFSTCHELRALAPG